MLVAHEDDFFIRTDNPVALTGPLERNESTLLYPLTPRWCFAALPLTQKATPKPQDPIRAWPILKGTAHLINFYCAKMAEQSVIVHPDHDNKISAIMLGDSEVIGAYPQPPFLVHPPDESQTLHTYRSVRHIQSSCDDIDYPEWTASDLESAASHLLNLLLDSDCRDWRR